MAPHQPLDDREKEVMRSLRFSRLLIPILIGIGVVGYLLWDQFDPEEFAKIQWRLHTLVWILIAFGFVVVRHIVYALRLYILSDKFFSFRKCIELIFIWEFSSAITPNWIATTAAAPANAGVRVKPLSHSRSAARAPFGAGEALGARLYS